MRKSAGFTLIELVIVIVILGILGAVAAPKFLNLQGDAYGANIKALSGSLQSAASLANAKAILDNKDSGDGEDNKGVKGIEGYEEVVFKFGYPSVGTKSGVGSKAWQDGILGTLQNELSSSDYDIKLSTDGKTLEIRPAGRVSSTTCFVEYTEATSATVGAKIEFENECD